MKEIKLYVQEKLEYLKNYIYNNKLHIKMVIISVGADPASQVYIKGKLKDTAEVGIECEVRHFSEEISEAELLLEVAKCNTDSTVTGFIVQLPLPKHIHEEAIIEAIDPNKDVDGFSKKHLVDPATPTGIIDYLEANKFNFENANAVVIGRSNIVCRPMARLLLDKSCNVRVIHSKTSVYNKIAALKYANLVVVATGHRNTLVDNELYDAENEEEYWPTWIVNPNCFIVDVGMNRNEEGKLCGDCETVTVCEKTPVPGGVGLLTRLALITNLLKLYEGR